MSEAPEPLVVVATTDLCAVTRGRSVPEHRLAKVAASGIGWVPANISLTALGTIADPNPWGSSGDLRILPDLTARYRTGLTGSATPFDMVAGDIVELDGAPWAACTRTLLRQALADLRARTGLAVVAAFEQEFQLVDAALPEAHPFSLSALRRTDPFAPRLQAALQEAGVEPEMVIAEYGRDQFEIVHAPADALAAADRAVAIREITREVARNLGWRASFAPKTAPDGVGNGVHVHLSFLDPAGRPAAYDPARPGRLSAAAGSFCAGILHHLPALTAFSAPGVSSYYRLKPHSWSSSYTWLADRDREATLRICPTVGFGGGDPARQFNIEFRAADATANPYLVLAALIRAGLEGLAAEMPAPPLVSGDPTAMTPAQRDALGLVRLPETLAAALAALEADTVARGWFAPVFVETYLGVKRAEMAALGERDAAAVCALYRTLY
ncbi:glutamine synthetase family protein [Labrys wisconsinensis]|uniref:Glutamine synthetase n=1 Tax=Labrys wisconsinensis TaxID=425677 RepID=A0ABU0JJ41_9HYPH|nr:glutamine synthetase family protein [Labrys wisconsinensis]MDQ0473279.1 glutamine synthetase [Labrys wisconsinensis]